MFLVTSASQNTPPPHIDSEKKPLDHRKLPFHAFAASPGAQLEVAIPEPHVEPSGAACVLAPSMIPMFTCAGFAGSRQVCGMCATDVSTGLSRVALFPIRTV